MFRNLEKNLLNILSKISVKVILLFIVLNIIVGATSYIYLDKTYKKNPTWIGKVKFVIPRYTLVPEDHLSIKYHEILSRTQLLQNFTEHRQTGKFHEICKINKGHFDDHIFYKWSKLGLDVSAYRVTLNIRHNSKEIVKNCVDEFKKIIKQSFDAERTRYINLLEMLMKYEKDFLAEIEKEYLELINSLGRNWNGIKKDTAEDNTNLSSGNSVRDFVSLFNLRNSSNSDINKIKKKINKFEYEIYEINKNLEVQIEFNNLQKSFRDFKPLLTLINLIFSFFIIFVFLILAKPKSNFKN